MFPKATRTMENEIDIVTLSLRATEGSAATLP
jgi:hypothetical protein